MPIAAFFFQASAQLILNCIRELYEKLKSTPDLVSSSTSVNPPASAQVTSTESGGARVLKPPPKPAASVPQPPAPQAPPQPTPTGEASAQSDKVYIIGDVNDPLRAQLSQFLNEIGLNEVGIVRQHGQMLPLDSLQVDAGIRFAFFIISTDDLAYAMFEIGHFVGKLGKNRVCVLHMSDVNVPKNIPGVITKSIVVKLEEASFGLLKDLKAQGYQINL